MTTSRRIFLSGFVGVPLFGLSSCGHLASFDVSEDISEQSVQGNPLGALLPSFLPQPFPITVDVKAETAKRDTGPASSVDLKSISFSITPHTTPNGNFDFVDEIHIYVETTQQTPLPKVEIANLSPVPKGQTTISLNVVPNVDLLPYVNAGATLTATASGHQPAQTTTYDGHIVVTINI